MKTQSAVKILILFLFAGAVFGANIPLQVVSVTSQQAEIQYTSPTVGSCTLALTDNSGLGVTVWDVNGSVFANANLDLSRPDTLLNGISRKVLLGHRTAEQGTNGMFYSRSLQADAPHTLTVICGSNSGTVQFATNTIQQGQAYPEMPQYCANGLWGRCLPTIDYSVAGKEIGYVDPLTGALVKRVTGPGESYARLASNQSLSYAKDVSGVSAWSNSTNAYQYNTSGPYSTSSTTGSPTSPAGAAIFIGWNSLNNQGNTFGGYGYGTTTSIDDFQLRVHALSTAGSTNIAGCFTIDGVTCWSPIIICPAPTGTAADIYFGNSNGNGTCALASWPNPTWLGPFSDWGAAMTKHPPTSFARNAQAVAATATSSGGVTTLTVNSYNGTNGQLFETDTPASAPIYVPGASAGSPQTCQNSVCTVNKVTDSQHLVLNENVGSLGSITVQQTAGFLVWKSSGTGTVSINANFDYANSQYLNLAGNSGELASCSLVTDTTQKTAAGATISGPPHLGELCYFQYSGVYFWDETSGSARYLSQNNGYKVAAGSIGIAANPFDPVSPNIWYSLAPVFSYTAPGNASQQFMSSTYNTANSYVNNPVIFPGQPESSTIAQALLTPAYGSPSGDITQQFNAYVATCCPLLSAAITAGVLPSNTFTFQGFFPNGLAGIAGPAGSYRLQNSFTWQFAYNLTAATPGFVGVLDSVTGTASAGTSGPLVGLGRWMGAHTEKPTGIGGYSWFGPNVPGYNPSPPLSGAYISPIDKVWRSTCGLAGNTGCTDATTSGAWDTGNTCLPDLGNSGISGAGYTNPGQCTTTVSPVTANNPFGPFTLSAASAASGGNTTYTGTLTPCASNACVGYQFVITGFANQHNNNDLSHGLGMFVVTASNSTSITVTNPSGIAETHAGTAAYAPSFAYSCPAATSAFWSTTQADANQQATTVANGGYWQTGNTIFPSPYYGQNNCVQIHLTSMPCEASSISAEKATWPCPGNSNAAALQPIRVGDSWIDREPVQACNDCEHGTIIQLTCSPMPCTIASTDITVWIYRQSLGVGVVPYPTLALGSNFGNRGKAQHGNGWGLSMVGGGAGNSSPAPWWFNSASIASGWYIDHWFLSGSHADTTAATPGTNAIATCLLTQNQTFGCRPMLNMPGDLGTLNNYYSVGYNPYNFNGSGALLSFNPADFETYPSAKQYVGSNDIKRFIADWHDLTSDTGGSFGYFQTSFTMTPSSAGTNIYLLTSSAGTAAGDEKSAPFYGNSGRYNLQNVSGPGSRISTTYGANQHCEARAVGDCVSGSAVGNIYVNAAFLETANPCQINQVAISSPCVFPAPASFSQGTIYNSYDPNPEGSGHIRLTGMFSLPGATPHFQHLRFNSTGTWGFYAVQMASAYRADIFAVRVPKIAADTVNRTTFVPIRTTLGAGNSAAIRFGYDLNFRCSGVTDSQGNFMSGYNDSCLTVASPTQSQPYMWSSEGTVKPVTCSSGCAINIPAISERYLYYRIERYSSAGALTYTGPTQRIAVP